MSEPGPEPAARRVPRPACPAGAAAGPGEGGGASAAGVAWGPELFARRFEAAAPRLWAVAAGVLGDPARAEDVLQEACVIALQKLDQFRPGTDFTAWIGRIVRFVALNRVRRRARRRTTPVGHEVFEAVVAEGPAEAPPVDARGELTADDVLGDELTRALRELAPTARACLLLRTLLELEYREIGSTLGIPEGTAMSHVHRARRALRARLAPDGGEGRAGGRS